MLGAVLAALGGIALLIPPHTYPLAMLAVCALLACMALQPFLVVISYLTFLLAWPQEWIPFFTQLPPVAEKVVGWIAIGTLLTTILARRRTIPLRHNVTYAVLGVLSGFAISFANAYWLTNYADAIYELLRLAAVYFVVANACVTKRATKTVLWWYFILTASLVFFSVNGYYHGIRQYRMGIWRAVGPGSSYADPNSHAASVIYALPLLYHYALYTKRKAIRISLAVISLFGIWNIVITGSRTAMVSFLALALFTVLRRRGRRWLYLLAMVLFLIGTLVVMPTQYKQRFESVTDVSSDTGAAESARGRWEGFRDGMIMLGRSPVTGIGLGCYGIYRGSEMNCWFQAHSLYGELLGETGIVGGVAFLMFLVTIVRTARDVIRRAKTLPNPEESRLYQHVAEGLLGAYLLLVVQGLGGHNLLRYNWFFLAAIVISVHRQVTDRATADQSTEPQPRGDAFRA